MREFILQHTRLQRPPDLPELQLHLADEVMPIWRLSDAAGAGAGGDPEPPYWAFAWVGGIAIARYLLDHPAEVSGREVLDLGAGSGVCAIAALIAGARSVLACDPAAESAAAVELNAAANGVAVRIAAGDVLRSEPPGVDLILAGDVCYEAKMSAKVLTWLGRAVTAGTRVLIGDPGRAYIPTTGLRRLAEYELRTTRELEERDTKSACVYELESAAGLKVG